MTRKRLEVTRDIDSNLLLNKYREEQDVRVSQRLLMVMHVKQGKTATQTAQILFTDKSTVSRWIGRFNAFGFEGLNDELRPGRPKKVDHTNLKTALNQTPVEFGYVNQVWDVGLVIDYLQKYQEIEIHPNYVYRLIRKLGFSLVKPSSRNYKSDPEKVQIFKKK